MNLQDFAAMCDRYDHGHCFSDDERTRQDGQRDERALKEVARMLVRTGIATEAEVVAVYNAAVARQWLENASSTFEWRRVPGLEVKA